MRSKVIATLMLASAASVLAAQSPVPRDETGRGAPGAEAFLARTGELGLTDQQVVRLAAIARRQAARRQALRESIDSARQRFAGGDTAARRAFAQRMRSDAQRARDAAREDRREALGVLNDDQQARAWELFAGRGLRGGQMGMRARGMRRMRMRGTGPGMNDRFRDERRVRPMRPPMGPGALEIEG